MLINKRDAHTQSNPQFFTNECWHMFVQMGIGCRREGVQGSGPADKEHLHPLCHAKLLEKSMRLALTCAKKLHL
jgi:hypothetical protein